MPGKPGSSPPCLTWAGSSVSPSLPVVLRRKLPRVGVHLDLCSLSAALLLRGTRVPQNVASPEWTYGRHSRAPSPVPGLTQEAGTCLRVGCTCQSPSSEGAWLRGQPRTRPTTCPAVSLGDAPGHPPLTTAPRGWFTEAPPAHGERGQGCGEEGSLLAAVLCSLLSLGGLLPWAPRQPWTRPSALQVGSWQV